MIVFAFTLIFLVPYSYVFVHYVVLMFYYYTPHVAFVYRFLGVKIPTVSGRFTSVKFTDFKPIARCFDKIRW